MKKLLVIVVIMLIAFSCKKQASDQLAPHLEDVVLENKEKDDQTKQIITERRKKCPEKNPNCQPPPTNNKGCLLFDFDGHNVNESLWGVFTCQPSGLSNSAVSDVLARARSYFSFNAAILITTDERVFNSHPVNKRMRIIISPTMPTGYEGFGGVAYLNSFNWFEDISGFVNADGLGNNSKFIADAASHEAGHGLSCRHNSRWQFNEDGSCVKLAEYIVGSLIMGNSYDSPSPRFGIAPNDLDCNLIQNDTLLINQSIRL